MICRILEKRKYCDGGKSTFKVLSPFTCLSPVLLFDIVSGHVSNCFLVSNISSMAGRMVLYLVGTNINTKGPLLTLKSLMQSTLYAFRPSVRSSGGFLR